MWLTNILVYGAVVWLTCAVIVTAAHHEAREVARRRHPANYVEVTDAAVVPIICPVCLSQCATGYLSQSGGTVGGWIELRGHECAGVAVS